MSKVVYVDPYVFDLYGNRLATEDELADLVTSEVDAVERESSLTLRSAVPVTVQVNNGQFLQDEPRIMLIFS